MTKPADKKSYKKIRLCQLVAATHTVEPALTTAQIAIRHDVGEKAIRNWLRQGSDAPKAFKDQNKWYVSISEYQNWEVRSKR
ncbi:hypothetical protein [Shewanella sp. GutDb-MelDb]|uniref:hypothetical protein n=1 Tax=Shewanella sp. GutDb-MelDb TaxID=2058316 RepID=UPI000C7C5247|nr:hypothetical protein [Shewanella sp. GutDb-MelDb]PKG55810.1 hypothetical protein CXF82_18420 [Shewanella sp. GutDb-MelDb]